MTFAPLLAVEAQTYNVLEWAFLGVLALMTIGIGLISLMVIVRLVEPRGFKVLLRRLAGKA